jgi:hypothetical protein
MNVLPAANIECQAQSERDSIGGFIKAAEESRLRDLNRSFGLVPFVWTHVSLRAAHVALVRTSARFTLLNRHMPVKKYRAELPNRK